MSINLRGEPEILGPPMEKLREALAALHGLDPITHLFFEKPITPRPKRGRDGQLVLTTSPQAQAKLNALAGMAEWFAFRIKAECRAVEQQSWRKHFCGRGTGKGEELKKLAVEQAQRLGWNPQDDHQAEAAGVLDYGLACFGVETPWADQALFSRAA